jgi:hypothetical protein
VVRNGEGMGNTYTFIKPVYKDSFLWNDKLGRPTPSQIGGTIELHNATIFQNYRDDVQRYGLWCAIVTLFKMLVTIKRDTTEVYYEAKE